MAAHFFKQNDETRAYCAWRSSVPFSVHFYSFLDRKMVELIKQQTGLSPSPQLNISLGFRDEIPNTYEPGETSRLHFVIGVADFTINVISFYWRSRTGNTVSIGDEEFDEDDLEYGVEGLKPELYYKELARHNNKKPPFKIGKLPFELDIRDFNYTMHIYLNLKDPAASGDISALLDQCIAKFNELAEARSLGKAKGPILKSVHNWKITELADNRLQLYLDAASPEVLKKILQELTQFESIVKVEMDLPE